jgi:hypothetical protein
MSHVDPVSRVRRLVDHAGAVLNVDHEEEVQSEKLCCGDSVEEDVVQVDAGAVLSDA